jgi:CheY-like chemotaxis protein
VSPARVLIVDNDPWIQRMVATVLGQGGHLVNLAGDAQGALTCASKVLPEVVITTVGLPVVDGWPWWERLRVMPEQSSTPIIFLTGANEDPAAIRGFDPVRDHQLAKPFRIEDLERRLHSVLSRLREGAVTDPPPPRRSLPDKPSRGLRPLSAMQGALDLIGLSSILMILEIERKTGILLLEQPQTAARLFIRKGRIIRAEMDAPNACSGTTAVYAALTWNTGRFDFLVGDVGGIDDIQASTAFLLMEGARRVDEASQGKPPT